MVGMSVPRFSSGLKNYYQASISSEDDETEISILTLPIDNLHLNHKIKLVKIDAEGHEPAVFKGMRKLVERDRPILII